MLRSWERPRPLSDEVDPTCDTFFRSPSGQQFLHRLRGAVLFVVTLCGAGGSRLAARVFLLAGLARWIGVSPASCQRTARTMTDQVADFGGAESQRLAAQMPAREITICEDETFHPQTCLVAMEPSPTSSSWSAAPRGARLRPGRPPSAPQPTACR